MNVNRKQVLPLVQADLDARIEKGAKQYGEPLTTHNGRDALWDAYEEVLDLALYLRQAIEEKKPVDACVHCGKTRGDHSHPSGFCPNETDGYGEKFDHSRTFKRKETK